jgi:hypothetical protein
LCNPRLSQEERDAVLVRYANISEMLFGDLRPDRGYELSLYKARTEEKLSHDKEVTASDDPVLS